MRNVRFTMIMLVLLVSTSGHCQIPDLIDSLNEQVVSLRHTYPDSSLRLGQKALELGRKHQLRDKEFSALHELCSTCYLNQWFDEAINYCQLATSLEGIDETRKSIPYLRLGLSNVHLANFNEAISSFLKYVEIARTLEDEDMLVDGLSSLGVAYLNDGNILKAAEYYRAALKIHQRIVSPGRHAYACQNYARIMVSLEKYDSAHYYFDKALELADEVNNSNAKYWVYAYMELMPEYSIEERIEFKRKALKLAYENRMSHEIAAMNYGLATLLVELNHVDEAVSYAEEAIHYGWLMEDHRLVLKTYNLLTKAMIAAGDYERSREYLSRYEFLKDSLSSHEIKGFESIMGANELVTQEREIEQFRDKLLTSQAINRRNQVILTGAVVLVVLIGIILAMNLRANKVKTKTNIELSRLNEQLDAALKEKDALTGMVVHDIRSPFNKIESLFNVYKMDNELSEDLAQLMANVKSVIKDSRELTNDLLEINQLEAGVFYEKSEKIHIREFIEDVINEYKLQASQKDITLHSRFSINDEVIVTDKYTMTRVVGNLLSNAIKYTPHGGEVEVGCCQEGEHFECYVKDNGPGIPADEQGLLFKKFSRASVEPTGSETSTGLGLYIVSVMVKKLNGSVSLESTVGQGSTFKFRLPIALEVPQNETGV